jgi:uncharacterized protein (DUF1697 family)
MPKRATVVKSEFKPFRLLIGRSCSSGPVEVRIRPVAPVGDPRTGDPKSLECDLTRTLCEAFGMEIAVVARTRDELAGVIARDPFAGLADDPARYQVSFLSAEPDSLRVRELEGAQVSPERVVVIGREVYAWHPGGVGRSELAGLITDRRLGVGVTARNWRTLTRLFELADQSNNPD